MTKKPKRPKQRWAVGARVVVGSRKYIVTGELPPPEPGSGIAQGYVLDSLDHAKTYEYTPFRGLTLIRGDLVRPGRAARRKAARAAAKAAKLAGNLPPRAAKVPAGLPPAPEAASDEVTFLRGLLLAVLRPGVNLTESLAKAASTDAAGAAITPKSRHG